MALFKSNAERGDEHYSKGRYLKAAECYLKAKSYPQAIDSYIQAGEIEQAVDIHAQRRQYREAGILLARHEKFNDAVSYLERADAYVEAGDAAKRIPNLGRAGRAYMKGHAFEKAAACFFQEGDTENGVRALTSWSDHLRGQRNPQQTDPVLEKDIREVDIRLAEVLPRLSRFDEAGKLLYEHGIFSRAATMYEKAGRMEDAARAYMDGGQLGRALDTLTKLDDVSVVSAELRAEIYRGNSLYDKAAEIFEDMGRLEAAAVAYEDAEEWERAARLWEKVNDLSQAAELFMRIRKFKDAARCYLGTQQFDKAAVAFVSAGDAKAAAGAFLRAGKHLQAGIHFLKADSPLEASKALEKVPKGSTKEQEKEHIHASFLLVPLLVQEGQVEDAQYRLELVEKSRARIPSSDISYLRGRIAEALGRYDSAITYYTNTINERPNFRDTRQRLKDCKERADSARRAATATSATKPSALVEDPGAAKVRDTAPVDQRRLEGTGARPHETAPIPKLGHSPSQTPSSGAPTITLAPEPHPSFYERDTAVLPWWDQTRFFTGFDLRRSRRPVLLSCLPSVDPQRSAACERARQQIAPLEHPAVLRLLDVTQLEGEDTLVYEFFEGKPLEATLTLHQTPPPPLESIQLIAQLSEALASAHKLGLVHRWLSPRTVLVDEAKRVKLVGLGLGDILDQHEGNRSHLGPEVLAGSLAGPATDVYSLGRLAITLLQPQLPQGWTHLDVLEPGDVVWSTDVETEIPSAILRLLVRCLERDPLRRPSMVEVQATLSSIGLLPGQMVADRYEILGELGSGGMSRVYRALDRMLKTEVAIKTVLSPALGKSSEDEERLLREVQLSRQITHQNVVRVHDIGRFPGGIFVTMELLDGPGLDALIHQEGAMPLGRVKHILLGITAALAEAHHMNIIHRDLKPGNVILADGRVKVLDFGIARQNDRATSALTRTGEVIGSPLYMAPEQIQGRELDDTCDLYALGVIAYTLLTGSEPFYGDSPTAIVLQHLNDPPPAIRKKRSSLPEAWADLLECLLAKNPRERYQRADEVANVLQSLPVEDL